MISSSIADVDDDQLQEIWSSGKLDALKLLSTDVASFTSFENLPPGVKTTIAFIHDYDKDYALQLKHHLGLFCFFLLPPFYLLNMRIEKDKMQRCEKNGRTMGW